MSASFWIGPILLLLVACLAIAVVRTRSLFAATMLNGMYSFLMALVWVNMASMDVAFTEAAVGAGISTFIFLGALVFTGGEEKKRGSFDLTALLLVGLTGGALIYGTSDMPAFGDGAAPVHRHLYPRFVAQDVGKIEPEEQGSGGGDQQVPPHESHGDFGHHVPNAVTAVLADYRGYDTLFEVAVILSAGVGVVLLLRTSPRPPRKELAQ